MSKMALSEQYQKKTDKQHILDNPDTYIGSVEKVDGSMWIYDNVSEKIILKDIEYIPGLYKLFDEGIVNCRDHVIRMITKQNDPSTKCVSYIKTTITEDGEISFENDGNGIDVAMHPDYNIWIPEMIFGHLRTSTNYNKEEKKIVGGKNGFGFKLVLIWSSCGKIETVDHVRGLKYEQEFKDNLSIISLPKITTVKNAKPYTKVSFKPDYTRLGLSGLSNDMLALLHKRIIDISAVTDQKNKKMNVRYNNENIEIKNFQQYIDLYIGKKDTTKRVYEENGERWEYAVALTPTHQFEQISFVNGICTFKGGKHVDYIINQITRKLYTYIDKKKKIQVNLNTIKEQLIIFVRADIENPSFDSQTKDFMNTPSTNFGSICTVSDAFIEKVAKMGVMDAACALSVIKENRIARKSDGLKIKSIRGIPNFIDANDAGTSKSSQCVLILCEGLSAMSGVVSGLSSDDRNRYGIYPLKGKLLNVRGELSKRIYENKEITDLKKILALESGKNYESLENVHRLLRYGKIMILTDSDVDGSHIKGLCVNLFQSEYSSLFRISGFISFMNTPILRAIKGQQKILFYNEGEYNTWKDDLPNSSVTGWTIKYFKGLGTSTSSEFKEYFTNNRIVDFVYTDNTTDDTIDKIFNKKRSDDRKQWLQSYSKTSYLNTTTPYVKYEDFVDKELIHFSIYDCQRSLPNLVDGMKTSQRKILYCAFKRNLVHEIKIAQFSGYISENACYHHGEASLHSTTIAMCQDFVGANNINLLQPKGQFGSRMQGGNDSASERYIFTNLSPITRLIFKSDDDSILTNVLDDGITVEPEFYIPIIPFVLVNGLIGIGTGFSTSIPSFNPLQIVDYIKNKLNGIRNIHQWIPYYENFKGSVIIVPNEPDKFLIKGTYIKIDDNTVLINELPIGTWTMPYLSFLETLIDGCTKDKIKQKQTVKEFISKSTEKNVEIRITFLNNVLSSLENDIEKSGINGVEKLLKLTTTVSTSNMHLFNKDFKLKKYSNIEQIIDEFYDIRHDAYEKRKQNLIKQYNIVLTKVSMKAMYITLVLDNIIDLRRKTTRQIEELFHKHQLIQIDESFDYLLKMPMISVSEENYLKLLQDKTDTEIELHRLQNTSVKEMWLKEIIEFDTEYTKYKLHRSVEYTSSDKTQSTSSSKSNTIVVNQKKRKISS
jgi:DNA topoisomerase-2